METAATVETPVESAPRPANPQRQRRKNVRVRGVFERPKGSDIWWVRFVDAQGRYHREKAGTKGAAIDLYRRRKDEALRGRKLPETMRRRGATVGELLDAAVAYAKSHHRSPHSYARYAKFLQGIFGAAVASTLAPGAIEARLGRIAIERAWKPASFNRHRSALSLAFRLGVENEIVETNPVRLVHQRHEDNARVRWLTAKEEEGLRAVLRRDYPGEMAAFDLALHTGMRRSEQYRLAWGCVDLERRQITIPRSKHGGIRYVPLDDTALAALAELRSRGNGVGPVMVRADGGHGVSRGEAVRSPRMWFEAACKKAGVADFTWHCLRHTFASRLVMSGVSLRLVQEVMGHKTITMTCRYAHLAPDYQLEAVRRLDGWGKQDSDAPTGTTVAPAPIPNPEGPAKVNRIN